MLSGHLDRLAALPAHGNRKLVFDQLFVALLLAFYNPIVRSLRLIEDCGSMNGRLELDKLARSTTSDALAVFDPNQLLPVIHDLRQRACALKQVDDSLHVITQRIIAADGTYLNTLADVAWALLHTKSDGKKQGQVRLNVQLDVGNWTPQVVTVSGNDGSEADAFVPDLLDDVLYVVDRNFLNFSFLKQLQCNGRNVVLRVHADKPIMRIEQRRTLDEADRAGGVVSDEFVRLTGRDAPPGVWRLVTIHTTNRKNELEVIRLLSSLTDEQIPARVIGAVYKLRWQIELFFKWLKCWAGMDHLFSTTRQGITFQFYVAVIAVLLMYVQLGRRVSRYALSAMHNLLHGQITYAQMMAVIERREREKTLARLRAEKKRLKNQQA